MNRLSIEAVGTIIDASSVATAIVHRNGALVCANAALRKLLDLEASTASLSDAFEQPQDLRDVLRSAARASGAHPAFLRTRIDRKRVSATVQPLDAQQGRAARHFLVTLQGRSAARQKMLELTRDLNEAAVHRRRLLEQNKALKATVDKTIPRLRSLTISDALTGLKNRRYYDDQLAREWRRCLRTRDALSLVMIDIDHFKRYNDSCGHPAGDRCLKRIASAIAAAVSREFDAVCRIGGEEFAILLPMTADAGATFVANAVIDAVRALALSHPDGGIVTVSMGVGTCIPAQRSAASAFVDRVDRALYASKEAGRNRVTGLDGARKDAFEPRGLPSAPDAHP